MSSPTRPAPTTRSGYIPAGMTLDEGRRCGPAIPRYVQRAVDSMTQHVAGHARLAGAAVVFDYGNNLRQHSTTG